MGAVMDAHHRVRQIRRHCRGRLLPEFSATDVLWTWSPGEELVPRAGMSQPPPPSSYPASGTLRDGLWIRNVPSRFTCEQVADYLSTIEYTPTYDPKRIESGHFPTNPDALERLVRLHLLTFPFENTSMH